MKKALLMAVSLACIGAVAQAEEMTFVTTMSAPIGTFARLDTANPAAKTKTPIVNFCNTRVSTGEITLRGAGAYLQKVNLTRNTTLGGDVPEYRITDDGTLRMGPGGTLTGGTLLADKVTLTNAATHKGKVEGTLYASTASTTGARTDNMTIASTARISKGGPQDTLEWSNEYSSNYKADGTVAGGSYSSYLLKSKGSGTSTEPACQPTKGQTYREICPVGQTGSITYTWDSTFCRYRKTSSCKDSDAGKYTCITEVAWKQTKIREKWDPSYGTEHDWRYTAYDTRMVCGGETAHHSGTENFAFGREVDCEPGKYYLHWETYQCMTEPGVGYNMERKNGIATRLGWYCLKCGRVDSLNKCADAPKKMSGQHCSVGGNGRSDFKPNNPGLMP